MDNYYSTNPFTLSFEYEYFNLRIVSILYLIVYIVCNNLILLNKIFIQFIVFTTDSEVHLFIIYPKF